MKLRFEIKFLELEQSQFVVMVCDVSKSIVLKD